MTLECDYNKRLITFKTDYTKRVLVYKQSRDLYGNRELLKGHLAVTSFMDNPKQAISFHFSFPKQII
jgi:hypothetical protein